MKFNKWVLITGVSSGIGLYNANEMVKGPYRVIGSVRDRNIQYKTLDPRVVLIEMDQSSETSISNAFQVINQILGNEKLFALINNAGIAVPGPLVELPMEQFKEQFNVNLFGVLKCTQLAFPLFETGSRIINISSVSGLITSPFTGAYSSSKFALEALSDALRRELMLLGIKVILIEPGPLKTKIWQKNLGVGENYKNSVFSDVLARADAIIEETERNALPVEAIWPSINKALELKNPSNRYIVHKRAWMIKILAHFFPSKYLDQMIFKNLRSQNHKIRPI